MTLKITYDGGSEVKEAHYEGAKAPSILGGVFLVVHDLNGRMVAWFPLTRLIKVSFSDNQVLTH